MSVAVIVCLSARERDYVKFSSDSTSSSAMAERPRELGFFKGVGHFEASF